MIHYETLILAAPEITSGETADLETFFEKTLKKVQATVTSFERWGKYRLAYPVAKKEYGVYFLARYEVDEANAKDVLNEVHALFTVKLPQTVLRHMTTSLEGRKSIAYQRPQSLEDTPASQDVDTFIRENKIEGFLKKPSGRYEQGYKKHGAQREQEKTPVTDSSSDEIIG